MRPLGVPRGFVRFRAVGRWAYFRNGRYFPQPRIKNLPYQILRLRRHLLSDLRCIPDVFMERNQTTEFLRGYRSINHVCPGLAIIILSRARLSSIHFVCSSVCSLDGGVEKKYLLVKVIFVVLSPVGKNLYIS